MSLHLVQSTPDIALLTRWGADRGFLVGDDLGYTLHACLNAAFPEVRFRPFVLLDDFAGNNRPQLLGYVDKTGQELSEISGAFGEPAALDALGQVSTKAMPAFEKGRRLGFDVVAAPIVRSWEDREGAPRRRTEHDVFAYAARRAEDAKALDKDAVYCDWLEGRLAEIGVDVVRCRVVRRRIVEAGRRDRSGTNGTRLVKVRSPEVRFQGVFEIVDAEAFAKGLAHGIGRHKAFGRGMIVLKPASSAA